MRDNRDEAETDYDLRRLFLFIGADPNTGWLGDCGVEVDAKGFILTGYDAPGCALESRQASLETSVPGVFAIGDVRANSTKRVAAAVGEGAAVVSRIHAFLAKRALDERVKGAPGCGGRSSAPRWPAPPTPPPCCRRR